MVSITPIWACELPPRKTSGQTVHTDRHTNYHIIHLPLLSSLNWRHFMYVSCSISLSQSHTQGNQTNITLTTSFLLLTHSNNDGDDYIWFFVRFLEKLFWISYYHLISRTQLGVVKFPKIFAISVGVSVFPYVVVWKFVIFSLGVSWHLKNAPKVRQIWYVEFLVKIHPQVFYCCPCYLCLLSQWHDIFLHPRNHISFIAEMKLFFPPWSL